MYSCHWAVSILYFVPNLLYFAVFSRLPVPPRSDSHKVEAMGIYEGATIVRGPDWRWGDQDGKLWLKKYASFLVCCDIILQLLHILEKYG